ncbi:MAG: hypothetical protein LLF76_00310 [Planctomycetaceae bacterium]|nr:hypothetical protein [Planctomycetaceae bacterium]
MSAPHLLVDLPANREGSWKLTEGIVCPHCCKPTRYFLLFGPAPDEYGRTIRSYIGYCDRCHSEFEVTQFQVGQLWPMHRCRLDGQEWKVIQPLPEPPLVQTGPGGDFSRAYSTEQLEAIVEKATKCLVDCGKIIATVRDSMKKEPRTNTNGH